MTQRKTPFYLYNQKKNELNASWFDNNSWHSSELSLPGSELNPFLQMKTLNEAQGVEGSPTLVGVWSQAIALVYWEGIGRTEELLKKKNPPQTKQQQTCKSF